MTPRPDDGAGGALRPPRHLVSPRAVRYWAVRAAAGWALVAAAQIAFWIASGATLGSLHALALGATVVAAAGHVVVMPRWRYRVHRWETTPEAVYTQAGWFDQERRIAPLSRIQTVDSERGPLEQLFGLTTVTITTASAAGELEIAGLDRTTADALVDDLTSAAQAGQDDAT